MHELTLCRQLCETLEAWAKSSSVVKIRQINLRIGCLTCVEPDALEFCFEAVAHSPLLQGAKLAIERAPAQAHCRNCGNNYTVTNWMDFCPQCESELRDLSETEELIIKSVQTDGP
ncbi:hydrogenase maturation nickel metallochaperone HypA [Corallincola platygyrae]|uniref:Hydrogenase maturation factor HypA n=1 Tax=Corallincola platygyrae TaxID=1193278 RepID=A0ABW4XKF5_9GAMM